MTVKIDKKAGIGSLECKVCGQRFQCTVNCTLEHPESRPDPIPRVRVVFEYVQEKANQRERNRPVGSGGRLR